ncbi:MAG: TetR/AcrR family transcriptional regulator [Streptosporangiaceae bacterium]
MPRASGRGEAVPRTPPGTRRRGSALEDALLDAAWDELREAGYARLTMEGVAQRAGTSRPVLARRWPTRHQLVVAALRRHRPMLSGEVPDTGSLRGDVREVLCRVSARFADLGPETFYGLAADYFADPALVPDFQAQMVQTGDQVMAAILKRAAERGETLDDIPPRVAALPFDLLRNTLLLSPGDEHAITEIVDQVFLPLVSR